MDSRTIKQKGLLIANCKVEQNFNGYLRLGLVVHEKIIQLFLVIFLIR